MEGAGIIDAVGNGCEFFTEIGMRVAYAGGSLGAYAQYRCINEDHLIRIPDEVDEQYAAALMVKGLTAYFLVANTFRVDHHCTVLIHAAAGGTGILLTQFAKKYGARVIGTAGSDEKCTLAKEFGADDMINYRTENVAKRVKELTDGKGVNVVYDGIGEATYPSSLDSLCTFGLLVSFGEASGAAPQVDLGELQRKGSLFVTRPNFLDHFGDQAHYIVGASEVMRAVMEGHVKPHIGQSYYLSHAAQAHADLEARKTTGSVVLVVDE
jgi:NADPH2:quinone reductase